MISFISLIVLVLSREGEHKPLRVLALSHTFHEKNSKQHQNNRSDVTAINFFKAKKENEGPNWPHWRGCSRISIHCEKILILDGIENGGFLTRCAQSTVGD